MIPIYEFSTGIKAERTPNGGWVSLGFLGKYINCTLEPIPYPVERSIANQEFALTEGASTDQPAIIGRVVGTGEDSWAVIAVVTRARDEKRRSLSVYRYFLTPGANNLRYLLAWWESQGRPTFNPFDGKYIGTYAYFDPASALSSDYDPTANYIELVPTKPTLLEPYQYNLTTIHTLAIKKHNLDPTQPISWAFNVEAVEKPRSFQVIQPSSPTAYETLEREISKPPRSLPAVFIDEAALKSAIRALINNSQVKADAVQVIVKELNNKQITPQYWEALFDGQGASTAITQRNYSPPLVRLMTLRAIVIPETLPEFLKWLNIQSGKQPSEAESISLQFQGAIRGYFKGVKDQLTAGIKLLIPQLLKEKISPESIHWLFIKDRVWDVCLSQFLHDVHYDLQLIDQQSKVYTNTKNFDSLKFPKETWQDLIPLVGSRYQSSHINKYFSLAQLFDLLKDYKLCTYFYQVSQGDVPKKLFYQAFGHVGTAETSENFLGLTIRREITLIEQSMKFIRSILPVVAGFSLLGLSWLGVYYLAGGFSSWREEMKTLESETKNIKETKEEINKIVNNLTNKQQYNREDVIKKLETVLVFKKLNATLTQPEDSPEPTMDELKSTIAKLKTAIDDIELSQAISAYHEVKIARTPQKFNLWSNQPDMRSTYQKLEEEVSAALKEDVINKALNQTNFGKTTASLKSIIRETRSPSPVTRNIEQLLITQLGLREKIENLEPVKEEEKKDLVEAIYKYQENNPGLTPDGIIDKDGETYERLKQAL
ncbi:hypothetical protein [Anabaenopsis arnoldii]|uniref:Rhodanese domain-containing protein n=1 Tax=Anabaenopsis arnoldii TaxID=2152938 RepID=A0ABT5AS73_9CYAN|nr:hypothetical protein [Anabaenopsis arnoldii]MDB9540130.1 hypothetical protein [Anabaenopsis arnoldii]MDH6092524.1 hypothetical protein [Anabaenopsis arnoldii]